MDSNRPIYVKCHRKHLDPRTLNSYHLPWEWEGGDENSDYLLIKQYIDEDLQEELFEHTRSLRGNAQHSSHGPPHPSRSSYAIPKCFQTGAPLSFDVDLKAPVPKGKPVAVKPVSIPDDLDGGRMNVLSSRIHRDDEVALYRKGASMDNEATQFSWIHMQKEERNFDDFTRFASSVPGLADEDVALVLSLLKKVRQNEKPAYSGKFLQPTVLRCDGRESSRLNEPAEERSAVFICFPYYSVEPMADVKQVSNDPSTHHTRSLLQTFYNLESTGKRDLDQVIRKTGPFLKDHLIYVPQLWAIILNSGIVITSASISPFYAAKHSLKILDPPKLQTASSPSVIRVDDPRQRTFFLPMEHCKTWFALMDKVIHHCLIGYNLQERECQLLTSDNVPISSEDWQTLITKNSTILSIRIQLLSLEKPDPKDQSPDNKSVSQFSDIEHKQGYVDPSTRSYTRGSTMERKGTAETYHARRGTSMSLVKRVPTWRPDKSGKRPDDKEKYDSDNDNTWRGRNWRLARYHGSDSPPPNRIPKYPLPPSSGVVVNKAERKSPYAYDTSDIYFVPQNATVAEDNSTRSSLLGRQATEPRARKTPSDIEHSIGRLARETTVPPMDQEKPNPRSITPASSDVKLQLHVPPVFTWAVGRRSEMVDRSEGNGSSGDTGSDSNTDAKGPKAEQQYTMADPSREEEETLDNVSDHIHSQLLDEGQYGEDVLYRNAATVSLFDVEKMAKNTLKTSVPTLMNRRLGAGNTETDNNSPAWRNDMKWAASIIFKLFDYYIPLPYPCDIADRYWGAVQDIFTIIPKLCDMSESTGRPDETKRTDWYTIVDLSDPSEADLRNAKDMRLLTRDITDCTACTEGRYYPSRSEALNHLFANHFTIPTTEGSAISPNWVMDHEKCLSFKRRRDGQTILRTLIDHGTELERLGLEIQHGVSENGKFDRDTYRIPSSLVDSFRHLLMMVVLAGHIAKSVYRQEYNSIEIPFYFSFIQDRLLGRLLKCGSSAEACMDDAKREIVLMTYTDDSSDIVSYEAVSPELVLALVMGDIRCRDSLNNRVNLIEMYQNYLLKLQLKVNQNPQRRLLQDIHYVVEELGILQDISRQQHLIIGNYRQVLHPSTFRVTTEARISAFTLESDRLEKLGKIMIDEGAAIHSLIQKAGYLSGQTQRGVEVRQEDHGKAILAFTIVTVVFLPMSFVTSFFGMNTIDIRETSSAQGLFWAIALPLTFVMITLTLFVGFKGDTIRERIVERLTPRGRQTPNQHVGAIDQSRGGMVEGSGNNINETLLKKRGIWREPKSTLGVSSEHFV